MKVDFVLFDVCSSVAQFVVHLSMIDMLRRLILCEIPGLWLILRHFLGTCGNCHPAQFVLIYIDISSKTCKY